MTIRQLEQDNPLAAGFVARAGRDLASVAELTDELKVELARSGVEACVRAADVALERLRSRSFGRTAFMNLHLALTRALSFEDLDEAIRFGEAYADVFGDKRLIRSLVIFLRRAGEFDRALARLSDLEPDEWRAKYRSELVRLCRVAALREKHPELDAAAAEGDDALRALGERLASDIGVDVARLVVYQIAKREFRARNRLSQLVIDYGELLASDPTPPPRLAFDVCDAYLYQGNITAALGALDRLGDDEDVADKRRRVSAFARLRDRGFTDELRRTAPTGWTSEPGRVLVPLHNSLPYDSGGYASRTHGLLSNIAAVGWRISGVTRLGYPQDRKKHRGVPWLSSSRVDDIAYFRLRKDGCAYGQIPLYDYLYEYADALFDLCVRERPEVLYAPSNYMNGVAANAVGRALGIKTVYEVRGLWEITRISRQPAWESGEYFEMMRQMEAQAAIEADQVTCITIALKDEMVRRGVPADKITIVPNGVDTDRFLPRARDEALARELGLAGKRVIGYIGSVVDYEGLDDLMRAVALLKQRSTPDFGVLIVGDGAVLDDVKAVASELGLDDTVVFTGRVPHEEVERYYSVIDIAPFPRKSLPVTEMVSPLKPFEAMAMEKVVVASSVAALEEIVTDGVNGYLFAKGNIDALADVLETVLDPAAAGELRPREWVVENRDWKKIAAIVDGVFKRAIGDPRGADTARVDTVPPDRIAELYLGTSGTAFSPNAAAEARDRVDWMVENAVGDSVLDVGCSQGISTLLLARAGRQVFGVEPNEDAVAYARELVAAEPADVAARVSFANASIEELPVDGARYDSAVCGEVIEHLDDPTGFLGAIWKRLRDGGTLVLTTPFAITSHKDHRSIFFLTNFYDLVSRWFETRELFVRHKKIHFVGVRRPEPLPARTEPLDREVLDQLLTLTEAAIVDLERGYYLPRIGELRKQLRRR